MRATSATLSRDPVAHVVLTARSGNVWFGTGNQVGRKSREKRERRERGEGPIAALVDGFSSDSLIPLLEAASVSPTAAHRGPSIASLFHAVAQRRRGGNKSATPNVLPKLVAGVLAALPGIGNMEDFRSFDPRSEVLVRWGPGLFRLLPGSLERPTAMVNHEALLASVIDRVLVPRLGFGLSDAGELILRRVDHVARCLTAHWPDVPVADVGDDPHVTQAEVDAANGLRSFEEMLGDCVFPNRAAAAAARYTFAAKKLQCDVSHPVSTFQTAIATRIGGTVVPLPAAFLIETLPAIGTELAAMASKADSNAGDLFAEVVANRIGRLFQGSGYSISGPIRTGSGSPIHSLIMFNERQILALDVAAGLTPAAIQARLDEGARGLERIRPGAEIRSRGGAWQLSADAQIARVQVIAGPQQGVLLEASVPVMGLEDLEWIIYSTQRSREDLWYFIRDLDDPRGVEGMFAWDLIDRWEVWRKQKTFCRGGVSLTTMLFSPHAAVAEWKEAAAAAPAEMTLHVLGLPPLRDWAIVALDHDRAIEVGDLRSKQAFQVMSWPVPVAISKIDSTSPSEHFSTLWSLAVGLAWKLEHSAKAFIEAAKQSGLGSLRIMFQFQERDSGPPLTVEGFAGGELSVGWDARLQGALAEDSFAVETLCGWLVSHALAPSIRDSFIEAWEAAPPGIRTDALGVRQRAQRLPKPLEAHDAVRSDVLRQLGEHLAASGIEPSVLEGPAATRFESHTIFPWLVAKFHETIAALSARELLEFALVQLECLHHHRFMIDKRLGSQRGFPVQMENDGVQQREPISRGARVISFITEEVLAHPPAGDGVVDDVAWKNALAIAELCIESCFRSDSIHHQLTRTSVEITNLFEVKVAYSDEPTDVDLRAYSEWRSLNELPAAVPITTGQNKGPPGDDDEPRAVIDSMLQLAGIDDAMRSSLGFGVDAITGLLNVATQWDADPSAPAMITSPDAVVDQCVEIAVGATRGEYAAALDWLTLRGTDLAGDTIPHWETERRAKRTITSPFVAADDGVWVLPWTAESTLRIVASYLGDGRLPWPDTVLPRRLLRRWPDTGSAGIARWRRTALPRWKRKPSLYAAV